MPQWGRFETSIPNAATYSDPYRDVTLNVTFTAPDGATSPFWGFYDGPQNWKIRFMPHLTGTWQYNATFSDGQPGASGTFTCTASANPGMISAYGPNPRWFGLKSGQPIMMRSFHAANLFRFAIDDPANPNDGNLRTAFLDWAAAQGYNTFSATSHFSDSNAAGPKLWPLNYQTFQKVETILNDLSDRQMVIYGFGGFFPRSGDYPTTLEDRTTYIRYCLARFAPYWNQVWNVGGPEPNIDNYISATLVNEIGAAIKADDPFAHLLGVHNKDGDDPYRNQSWSSYVTLQHELTNLTTLSNYLISNYVTGKPVYAQETIWLGNTLQPAWTLTDLRKHMWVHMMAAASINVGDMNGNNTSGFGGTLNLADKVQGRHDVPKMVWDFMETIPFEKMTPRQDLRSSGYMLAEVGRQYLCYLPSGGSVNVTVLSSAAPYSVKWINAQNPLGDQRNGDPTPNGQGLTAPDANDWLVYLTSDGPIEPSTDVSLLVGDTAPGQTSFNTGAKWSDGMAPRAGHNYFVTSLDLRSPNTTNGTSYTFQGDSLTVRDGGRFLNPTTGGNAVVTINDLRLDNGGMSTPVENATVNVAGVITLLQGGGFFNSTNSTRTLVVSARVTGAGALTINPANVGSVIVSGTGNDFSGGTSVTQGTFAVRRDQALGTGDVTVANGATLRLEQGATHDYIADTATLRLSSTATANLNFTGTERIGWLSLDGGATFAAAGTWGAIGSGAQFTTSRITGSGLLQVGIPPVVSTADATNVTYNGFTLMGSVTPSGIATTYYFEYGLSEAYGSVTATGTAGSGTSAVDVSVALSSLSAATYHYRLVATNAGGTSYGSDQTVNLATVDDNQDGMPDYWQASYGLSTTASIPGLDTDWDGTSDLMEFALGMNPTVAGTTELPAVDKTTANGVDYPTIEFRKRRDYSSLYQVEETTNFSQWNTIDQTANAIGVPVDLGNGFDLVKVRGNSPLTGPTPANKAFLRLRVLIP